MSVTSPMFRRAWRATLAGVALFAVASCSSVYRNHGHVPSEAELSEIKVGVDTRDTVAESIGTPSVSGVLDSGNYYYVATRFRHYGPREPEIVDRQLVAISFDSRGVVRNIERYGLRDGQFVPLQRRVTDSGVQDKTFLRQLLGNLGRFNPGTVLGE
ncbi:outer membrane protein assembly factor BamE [Pukyongiella litopenaei]|uniref:Outer membrane protein assembly factor BamE n=2 Tax=Pukyongiella litopenaei TaxID=2605946 RepID=A0A2S0MUQ1_9RHOB|nr:outer membrane protein assembly factor BamE [Pukyongiella litopenaei]